MTARWTLCKEIYFVINAQLGRRISAAALATAAGLALAACSSDEEENNAPDSAATTQAESTEGSEGGDSATPEQPTAADLNAVLATATDPAASEEDKVATVQGGETAPELFETMAASKAETGATFEVVDPVLPGYAPQSVLATVNFSVPEEPGQTADNVEFVYEDGKWKLSQSWACTLITNTVAPEQVPAMCTDGSVENNDGAVSEQ